MKNILKSPSTLSQDIFFRTIHTHNIFQDRQVILIPSHALVLTTSALPLSSRYLATHHSAFAAISLVSSLHATRHFSSSHHVALDIPHLTYVLSDLYPQKVYGPDGVPHVLYKNGVSVYFRLHQYIFCRNYIYIKIVQKERNAPILLFWRFV